MQFLFDKLYTAQIIDNNDPNQEGRVKIYVPSFMSGFSQDHFPWARPFFNEPGGDFGQTEIALYCVPAGNNNPSAKPFRFGESNIPEKNTLIWVWFENDEHKRNPFYITGTQLSGSSPHDSFNKTVATSLPDIQSVYPDVKYKILPNGFCFFYSSSLKFIENGLWNSSDSYFYQKDDKSDQNTHLQLARWVTGKVSIEQKYSSTTPDYYSKISTDTNNFINIENNNGNTSIKLESGDDNNYINLQNDSGTLAIELKSGTDNDTEKMLLGETVNKMISDLLDAIEAITVGTIGGPSSPPLNNTQFEMIRSNYLSSPSGSAKNILSKNIKNN